MIARRQFVGVIKGVEKSFARGDTITEAEADEMNLSEKPDIAGKENARGTKTPKT